jgi:hypothetical protein
VLFFCSIPSRSYISYFPGRQCTPPRNCTSYQSHSRFLQHIYRFTVFCRLPH